MKKTSVQYIQVDADFAGQRIDNFLLTRLKNVPKSHIYRILRKGEVRVNKKRIQPSYRLQEDDSIRVPPVSLEEKKGPLPPNKYWMNTLSNRILYEDSHLLIINKPSGIPVHGGSGVNQGLIEILRSMFPSSPHLELAHRLDAETSGCLILAKKRSILKELHELMRSGAVRKVYLALTKGHWKKAELIVEAKLQKNHLASGERMVRVSQEGKASCTHFKTIQKFTDAELVEATLLTGRTHQIRVHAQYMKHPVAGDAKYGDKEFDKKIRQLGVNRLFLHSKLVEFTLPSVGKVVSVVAPLDDDLRSCLKALD